MFVVCLFLVKFLLEYFCFFCGWVIKNFWFFINFFLLCICLVVKYFCLLLYEILVFLSFICKWLWLIKVFFVILGSFIFVFFCCGVLRLNLLVLLDRMGLRLFWKVFEDFFFDFFLCLFLEICFCGRFDKDVCFFFLFLIGKLRFLFKFC